MKVENENLVSIIIPAYNCEKFIKYAIESVLNQTYEDWELIVVNDCSTDTTKDLIEKFIDDRIKLIDLKENVGAAIARNTGIDAAKGRYIAFLDADDFWKKDKLEKQICFMKQKNCVFCFTGYEFTNESGQKTGRNVSVPRKINYKQALKNTIIFTSSVIFDISSLGKETVKMPNFKRGQDTATWWKVLRIVDGYGLQENLAFYRRSKNTLSSNKFKALKRTWILYRKSEEFSIIKSMYYFTFYVINALKRRI